MGIFKDNNSYIIKRISLFKKKILVFFNSESNNVNIHKLIQEKNLTLLKLTDRKYLHLFKFEIFR